MAGPEIARRTLLGVAALLAVPGWRVDGKPVDTATALRALEAKSGGRLGVAALDTGSGRYVGHRSDERFGLCSTFKLPLAAVVLWEAERGNLWLDRVVALVPEDMVSGSPVTGAKLGATMSIRDLARATQTTSDNMAANLLLRELGGPARFTALLRKSGDKVTRVDRTEPMMNFVLKGEIRDTTSPRAMAETVGRFLTGGFLSAPARDMLVEWMVETRTGARRLRAGFPPDWKAGDKTGTGLAAGMVAKTNDVAIVWPGSGGPPVIVAAYLDSASEGSAMSPADEAVLAQVGQVTAQWMT